MATSLPERRRLRRQALGQRIVINEKRCDVGLGSYPAVSLAQELSRLSATARPFPRAVIPLKRVKRPPAIQFRQSPPPPKPLPA